MQAKKNRLSKNKHTSHKLKNNHKLKSASKVKQTDDEGHRVGWKCELVAGTCNLKRMTDWVGLGTPSFLECGSNQKCEVGNCVCQAGMCLNPQTSQCEPGIPPENRVPKPNAEKIMCPVLAAMYNAGDLLPSLDGMVSLNELKSALHNALGVDISFASFQAKGVAGYKEHDIENKHRSRCFTGTMCWFNNLITQSKTGNRYLNIFKLNENKNVEHGFSTGVREGPESDPENVCNGVFPCQKRFDDYYAANADANGRIYRQNIDQITCMAKQFGDRGGEFSYKSSRFLREWQIKAAINGWLDGFGRLDENGQLYLTLEDARGFLMDGMYPIGWQRRYWGNLGKVYEHTIHQLPCEDVDVDQLLKKAEQQSQVGQEQVVQADQQKKRRKIRKHHH